MGATNFRQTAKVGVAGSFINQLMSNNSSTPKVGEYCTFLHYTDRSVGIVREVSKDFKTVKIEDCSTSADKSSTENLPMGHQCWKHEPNGNVSTYVWRNGAWRQVGREVVFTEEFRKSIPSDFIGIYLRKNNPELADKIYNGRPMPQVVVDGVTKEKKVYPSVKVLFNVCDYYYDWSF